QCCQECAKAFEQDEPVEFTEFYQPLGRWYFIRAVPHGEKLVVSFRDVTAAKEADMVLRDSRALLSQVLEVLPIGVWVLDRDGTIVSANPEAKRIWGGAHFVGIPDFSIYKGWRHDTGLPVAPEDWSAARAIRYNQPILDEELDILAFDGEPRVIRASAVPLHDREGSLSGCIAVNQEITGQKRVEAALERALLEAHRANQSKSRMVAGLAHDLQQPLLGIRLNLAHLLADLPPEKAEIVRTVIRSVESAERMVDSLTEVTAIEAGSVRPKPIDMDLTEVVRATCAEFRAAADDKGLRLSCRSGTAPAMVHSDPLLLQRAVRNLVSNALRYTDEGAVAVALRRRSDHYLVEVWDTGRGFPESALPHVFGEVVDPHAPSPKGFGIGLAAVSAIAGLLGIEVSARSRVGAGSVFRLKVPAISPTA
ncbi:MAG TPA: ATP-binding protein, partial [Candidatus Omnitrophota bacterium]|nr:ATP-binding protein [Candidatus Omnitrophota bacterium]